MIDEKNIMLIGFMGTGKSTISKKLSKMTERKEIDMDAYIVEKEGCSINDIFEQYGEDYFREKETKHLIDILKENGAIISCGGGAVVKPDNVKYMKEKGIIVLLTATPETVYERVKSSNERPILNGNMNVEYIESLMNKRRDIYLSVADIIVSTDNRKVRDICNEIIEKYSALNIR